MMSTTTIPSGFRSLSPEETHAVSGGLSIGKYTIIGGGFGTGSAFSNPMKFPADFDLATFQAGIAAMLAWLEAGMPIPQIDLGPGIQPSPTAPPIMSGPAPATGGTAPAGSTSGGSGDAHTHLQ